ncbi:RluA family pseudouridine synthase [Mycoavidus sp. B2-EB]|uniref:RluA family pseudouridine synthase n=1 Tax=Mycoavidus sp. B2-EB TaxID=2651972 RepID=UPI001624086F|nr:RluA family pseudouridine synthase [Mycoavidus sp. B2-EB]BBO59970.1 pseudouridine synthase [Mycoavidus sp. B2-EB]
MTRFRVEDYSSSPDSTTGFDTDIHAHDASALDSESADLASADELPYLMAQIPAALAGERLDKVLARLFPDYSRNRLQSWIEAGRVKVNGIPAQIRQAAPLDASILIAPELLPEETAFTAEPVPLEIIYEDAALVVINKPAGLVVHPAAGNWRGTVLNGLLHRYGKAAAGLPRAGIVHRLDKDTSGLMVIARTLTAQTHLIRQLQARTVKRRYLAFVWGTPNAQGTIHAPLGRDPRNRIRMAVVSETSGKPACTHYRRIATGNLAGQPFALMECDLETGRTHQIRVHLAHLGHPLIGDPLYCKTARYTQLLATTRAAGFARQALHAWQLKLNHPLNNLICAWRAPAPADILLLADALGLTPAVINDTIEAEELNDNDKKHPLT